MNPIRPRMDYYYINILQQRRVTKVHIPNQPKSIRDQQSSQRHQRRSSDTVKLSGAERRATLSSSFKGKHRRVQMLGVPAAPGKVWSISCWHCRISRHPRISTYVICCQKEWTHLINSHHEPMLERPVKL